MYDAIVVGGGPMGTATARKLAEGGADVLVVEEHETVGRPVQCAGLFTPRLFDMVPADCTDIQSNHIRRAHVYSPNGQRLDIEAEETQAIATDRAAFDQRMAQLAAHAGATVETGTKCVAADWRADRVELTLRSKDGERTEACRLVVGADGAQSRVAKWAGMFEPRQFVSLHGAQLTGLEELDPGGVEMWLGDDVAPNFFAYIVPTGDGEGKLEVGVWNSPRPAKDYYDALYRNPLVKRHIGDVREEFVISATIPFGPAKRSVGDRVVLVGDAAGQAKPTSGGGVYTGLVCVEHLAPVALQALAADDLSAAALQPYHDAWRGDIGRELWMGTKLRHAFVNLSDEDVNELWDILARPEVKEVIDTHGDIDYPSKVAFALVRTAPSLLKFAPKALKGFFSSPPTQA